jgi:hypothetical protein
MATAAMSATTMATGAMCATAGMCTTTGMSATEVATARRPTHSRPTGTHHDAVATAAVPAAPALAATPAEATAEGIAAPIVARTMPTIVIPAVVAATEEELGLLDIVRNSGRREAVEGKRVGLAGYAQKRKRSSSSPNPLSHNHLRFFFRNPMVVIEAGWSG